MMKSETIDRIRKFTEERDRDKFHSPSNLAKSIVIEAQNYWNVFNGQMKSMIYNILEKSWQMSLFIVRIF